MKAITVKEPWASLIANGYKEYEFRNWKTDYRGPLYIHAGKSNAKDALPRFKHLNLNYKSGNIVAICELVGCYKIEDVKIDKKNIVYRTSPKDGYAWKLTNIRKIDSNKEIVGKLSIWDIDPL